MLPQCDAALLRGSVLLRLDVAGLMLDDSPGITGFLVAVHVGQDARLAFVGLGQQHSCVLYRKE